MNPNETGSVVEASESSLWRRQGETWALIGARVGQRSLLVTADTYKHVLLDDRELDHASLVAPTAE
jgi:hypothetical protein